MFSLEFILYLLLIATGTLLGLANFNRLNKLKPVAILLAITFVCEIISRILAYYIKNSNPIYHLLNPLQCILWGYFFYHEIKSMIKKRWFAILSTCLLLYAIINSFFIGPLKFPDTFLSIQSIVLIGVGCLLFIEKLDEPNHENIFNDPGFIIGLALSYGFTSSLFYF
jgi:hypothetical protein